MLVFINLLGQLTFQGRLVSFTVFSIPSLLSLLDCIFCIYDVKLNEVSNKLLNLDNYDSLTCSTQIGVEDKVSVYASTVLPEVIQD